MAGTTSPAITHVALTVKDLSVSVPWYEALIGAAPVLDEDTGPFRHVVWALGDTLLGLHEFPDFSGHGVKGTTGVNRRPTNARPCSARDGEDLGAVFLLF